MILFTSVLEETSTAVGSDVGASSTSGDFESVLVFEIVILMLSLVFLVFDNLETIIDLVLVFLLVEGVDVDFLLLLVVSLPSEVSSSSVLSLFGLLLLLLFILFLLFLLALLLGVVLFVGDIESVGLGDSIILVIRLIIPVANFHLSPESRSDSFLPGLGSLLVLSERTGARSEVDKAFASLSFRLAIVVVLGDNVALVIDVVKAFIELVFELLLLAGENGLSAECDVLRTTNDGLLLLDLLGGSTDGRVSEAEALLLRFLLSIAGDVLVLNDLAVLDIQVIVLDFGVGRLILAMLVLRLGVALGLLNGNSLFGDDLLLLSGLLSLGGWLLLLLVQEGLEVLSFLRHFWRVVGDTRVWNVLISFAQ